ncbi:MAG: 5'/3'-nucleotidase SurE, partial [Candidatus Sumerlaeota bacterium]|nr:5'/3'-nucleotidase SurE [Candidatus Sumerlaeota bacterium]
MKGRVEDPMNPEPNKPEEHNREGAGDSPARPFVLLTNDDGIDAEGLRAMAAALAPHADLLIVAPNTECSAQGHAISVLKDMDLVPRPRAGERWGWGLCGTPADCVKVALTMLAGGRKVDLVISGINRGQNAGINILYSGTVAAAREAAILGLPAIAVSLYYQEEDRTPFATAARVGVEVFQMVRRHGLPPGVMLNVNVPPLAYERLRGWEAARMGNSGYYDLFQHRPSLEGRHAAYRNIGTEWFPSSPEAGDTDDAALMKGCVAISPLHFDLTAYEFLPRLNEWFAESSAAKIHR